MDRTAVINLISPSSLPLLLFLLPLIYIINLARRPAGPKPWPIVGNILQLGETRHIAITNFAKVFGPLISLRLGNKLLVVGSSPEAASDILRTHSQLLSARYIPKAVEPRDLDLNRIGLPWNPECSEAWKRLRAQCGTELFSAEATGSQAELREKKVAAMVEELGSWK